MAARRPRTQPQGERGDLPQRSGHGPNVDDGSESTSTLELLFAAPDGRAAEMVGRVLATVREHLAMDVAFVAERSPSKGLVCRFADGGRQALAANGLRVGRRVPLDDALVEPVLTDHRPVVLPGTGEASPPRDTRTGPGQPVAAYAAVPLRLTDGHPYGLLGCLRSGEGPPVGPREVGFLRSLARMLAAQIGDERRRARERTASTRRVRAVLRQGSLEMAYQPVVELDGGRPVGVEALARFPGRPSRAPDLWFAEAAAVGLGVRLELLAVETAVRVHGLLEPELYLAVNIGPQALVSPDLPAVLELAHPDRLVVEVTEHARIDDYPAVLDAVAWLRKAGARVAVDDAGSGYASLQHILRIAPDVIKLDLDLVRGIDHDPVRRALALSLTAFATDIGAVLVAEGVETTEEAETLGELGVRYAQGFLFARPGPIADLHEPAPSAV